MKIDKLNNHMRYGKIFELNKDENGKINWNNILNYPDLPLSFIDCYFYQLKPFGIERRIKLNDDIIKKYGSSLNWYQLLLNQNISEDILELFLDKFIAINLLIYVFKYQKLSLKFLLKHKKFFINNEHKKSFINALYQNIQIDQSIKNSFFRSI